MGLRRNRITKVNAENFLRSLDGLEIRLADPVSYDAVFELAQLSRLTVYDAANLASLDGALRNAAVNAGVVLLDP